MADTQINLYPSCAPRACGAAAILARAARVC